jgi:hypothetical protein
MPDTATRPPSPFGLDILRNFDEYRSLIERNHEVTLRSHLGRNRLESMQPVLLGQALPAA